VSGSAHILVVDDNPTNRKLVATLLTYEGFQVSEAADGAEGLAVARSVAPQLVISDILMPSMDGYEFVRRLRADPVTAAMRVIFYTANYHEREAQSLASQCGVARVIVKPCPAPVLIQAVTEVLAGEAAETAPLPESSFDVEHLRLLTDKLSQNANALRATNSRLAALTELNLQMASEHDPQQLLHSVCAYARALLGARFAVLAVTDRQRTDGVTACASGQPGKPVSGIQDPRKDQGILGKVFRERISQRLARAGDAAADMGLPPVFSEVRSAIAVPVCSLTRTYGWLCLGDKLGVDAFSSEDERLLTILGAQLGRIYENGTLYREVQEHAAQLMIEMEQRVIAIEKLRSSEERFRELAENIQDVFFVAGPDMVHTSYISPAYERVWGRPVEHILHRAGSWLETVHPADRERVQLEMGKVLQSFPEPGQVEFRIQRPDGAVRWVLTRIFPVRDSTGTVVRTVGATTDITASKTAELRIVRLNRTHSVLSGINSLIVRATDRDALLRDACHLAVGHGGFRAAWCGLLEGDSRELRATAYAGYASDLAASTRLTIDAATAEVSLVAEAMMSGKPAHCNDLTRADSRSLHREQFLAQGFRAMVALPLIVDGKSMGCFGLLADTPDYFDDEEMRLLKELADDISFALDHIGKSERLTYLARFDPLTGLANRRAFGERLGQYVGMAAHTRSSFAVVVVDPERFEALNNAMGRAAGDEVLRQAALRFAEAAGGQDVCGHIGSDQFAAIISGSVNGAGITRVLEELWRKWLATPFEVDGEAVELTAKSGVAIYPTDGTTADALLTNAAAALRMAKESGKAVGFYTRHISERIAERLALEKDLRRALEKGEYELHYQPKVDLAGGHITGLEALLRWRSPEHGLVAPGAFVPLLEENGMIVEVGAWALRQACLDRGRWLQQGLDAPRVAVNVSAVQLRRDDFVHMVEQVVQPAGAAAGLDIEVTESVLMNDVGENLLKLKAVRDFGVVIALDDFGTGYSSLAYLARLPVGVLKIDRSFVASMLEDPSVMTLVSTVISLGRSLKLVTVAEGVESEEQAKILRLLGCDQIQGYLISRPLPFDGITALLAGSAARRG
jgi:diguanylate cyclase (GGDEF)-like protein/PAS domain S-box-containing protein